MYWTLTWSCDNGSKFDSSYDTASRFHSSSAADR